MKNENQDPKIGPENMNRRNLLIARVLLTQYKSTEIKIYVHRIYYGLPLLAFHKNFPL